MKIKFAVINALIMLWAAFVAWLCGMILYNVYGLISPTIA